MQDTIGAIVMIAFMVACVGFPLFVFVQSIINLARASDGQGIIVLKAFLVIGVWVVISMIIGFIPIMYVFEPWKGDRATADLRLTIVMLVLTLIYIAIGLALGYWVRLQPGWKTLRRVKSEA